MFEPFPGNYVWNLVGQSRADLRRQHRRDRRRLPAAPRGRSARRGRRHGAVLRQLGQGRPPGHRQRQGRRSQGAPALGRHQVPARGGLPAGGRAHAAPRLGAALGHLPPGARDVPPRRRAAGAGGRVRRHPLRGNELPRPVRRRSRRRPQGALRGVAATAWTRSRSRSSASATRRASPPAASRR